ncbi:Ger(x)C family spore germination protein [Fictibacillus phosphorivorans]|uniref:Ger(x)C family spore germination protein n=1 Tax=Fictibacillus phosphorivorans TaxID=1221500 RepID=UPI0020403DBB|nr:Ger(x)C family spore germination protein [Fictibacillus phosphorivorans]MCM3718427.1 Ger(x)C family spore germination protein [Fictibacillus phosphorivorans]MCM3776051.1 Ger(x)C family spore germination protein [Fictibacillus phosphorivorans]
MKKFIITILVICIVGYFGRIDKEILDDLDIVTAVGYDYKGKRKIEATVVSPIINPDKSISNKTISSVGKMSKEALYFLNQKSPNPVVNGKIEVALFSEKLAKTRGVQNYIDYVHRDPSIGTRLILAVVDGNVKKMLGESFKDFDSGTYIQKQIDQNTKNGFIPTNNLHLFLSAYYTEGADPILPIIELRGKKINIKGLAFFKGSKMVDSIPYRSMFAFKSIYENIENAGYTLKTKDKGKTEYVSIQGIRTTKVYRVKNEQTTPEITLRLGIKGFLREYTGDKVNQELIDKSEKIMAKKVEKDAEALIRRFQKKGIDPLAWGEQTRSRTRHWDQKKWDQQYKNLKINVEVDVSIFEIGIVDGSPF